MSTNAYMNDYMKQRWAVRREKAVAALGGCCVECGSSDELHFDHINPETKLFAIAKGSGFSEERFAEELAKCQLLCADCHKRKHRAPHGTISRYKDCRCSACRQAKSEYSQAAYFRKKQAS